MDKFCAWNAETLAALLGDDDVLNIQSLSVNKSSIKPSESKSSGVKVFFGKQPKVCKNKPFKLLGLSSPKPSCSEPVSIKTCYDNIYSFLIHLSYACYLFIPGQESVQEE